MKPKTNALDWSCVRNDVHWTSYHRRACFRVCFCCSPLVSFLICLHTWSQRLRFYLFCAAVSCCSFFAQFTIMTNKNRNAEMKNRLNLCNRIAFASHSSTHRNQSHFISRKIKTKNWKITKFNRFFRNNCYRLANTHSHQTIIFSQALIFPTSEIRVHFRIINLFATKQQ